jgi:GT2 family glycosyltransferase
MSKKNETTAYIIVSWNNKDLLDECIQSIHAQEYVGKKKIVLVDNASSDETVEYLKDSYPEVEVIAELKNHGFAKGNNIAIAQALKDKTVSYVVLLNTDARLAPNWTQALISAAEKRPLAATLQSITLDYYNHSVVDSTHIFISRYGQANQGSWRLPISSGYDIAPQKVFGCNAAAMMITRKFIEAQPFEDLLDETMFMYLEDVDLAARATVMGWDNFVIPGTRAYHMGSVSSNKKDPRFSLYMTFRNNTGLLIKNLPTRTLAIMMVRMLKADIAAIRHLRRIGRGKAVPAVIKGRLVSLLFIPIFLAKRRTLKPLRIVNQDYLWRLMDRGY